MKFLITFLSTMTIVLISFCSTSAGPTTPPTTPPSSTRTNNVHEGPFISVWRTTEANQSITLPLEASGLYNFTIDWGDGSDEETITNTNATHNYTTAGGYTITIDGQIEGFRFADTGDKEKITNISHWGILKLGNNGIYFRGCNNLNITATDAPDLTETTNLNEMFYGCTSFNADLNHWDVSKVNNMSFMFTSTAFNSDISSWDVSKVNNMASMFQSATAFNRDINSWDVDQVTSCGNFKLGSGLSDANTPNFTRCSP